MSDQKEAFAVGEQTTSSIVIDAAPASVMSVIADFPAYPQWVQGVKKTDVVAEGDEVLMVDSGFHITGM